MDNITNTGQTEVILWLEDLEKNNQDFKKIIEDNTTKQLIITPTLEEFKKIIEAHENSKLEIKAFIIDLMINNTHDLSALDLPLTTSKEPYDIGQIVFENYLVKIIKPKNPNAKVLIFTSRPDSIVKQLESRYQRRNINYNHRILTKKSYDYNSEMELKKWVQGI